MENRFFLSAFSFAMFENGGTDLNIETSEASASDVLQCGDEIRGFIGHAGTREFLSSLGLGESQINYTGAERPNVMLPQRCDGFVVMPRGGVRGSVEVGAQAPYIFIRFRVRPR